MLDGRFEHHRQPLGFVIRWYDHRQVYGARVREGRERQGCRGRGVRAVFLLRGASYYWWWGPEDQCEVELENEGE